MSFYKDHYEEKEWTYIIRFPSGDCAPDHNGMMKDFNVKNLKEYKVFTDRQDAAEEAQSIAGKYAWRLMPLVIETVIE